MEEGASKADVGAADSCDNTQHVAIAAGKSKEPFKYITLFSINQKANSQLHIYPRTAL